MGARALPLVVRPKPGESVLSVQMRLAEENGVSVSTVIRDIGLLSYAESWERLACRLALDPARLSHLRQLSTDITTAPASVTFLGKAIRRQFLVKDHVRICPSCIGERRILKDVWRLVHSVACGDHRNMLIDTCRCGRPFNPATHGTKPFTCRCGLPMAENVAPAATTAAIKCADWLLQAFGGPAIGRSPKLWLVKGGTLDTPFSTMEPHDVMCVIDIVGQAATVPASEDKRMNPHARIHMGNLAGRRDLQSSSKQVEAAMKVLQDWPASYQRLLSDVAGRNPISSQPTPNQLFATRIGQFMVTPYRALDGMPIAPLQDEVDAFLSVNGHRVRQKVPIRVSATARAIHGVMPCSRVERILKIPNRRAVVGRIYRETIEAFDIAGAEYEDAEALGRAVLDEVHQRIAAGLEQISAGQAAKILGHASMETNPEMWVHPGLLNAVNPDRSVVAKIKGKAFLKHEVEALRIRIEASAQHVAPDAVPAGFKRYKVGCKASVGPDYTGSDLIIDLLAGIVPSVSTVPNPGLSDLQIDVRAARLRALSRRISRIIRDDQFAATQRCEQVLSTLWPNRGECLGSDVNRHLRDASAIRFEEKLNTTEGRSRPLYWYSIVDHMVRALARYGPSIAPEVNAELVSIRTARA